MNATRMAALFGKEVRHGSKNFIFVFALVMPFVFSLIISLLLGSLFAGKPRLGVADGGDSELVRRTREQTGIVVKDFASTGDLKTATESGAVDMGLIIPEGFDAAVAAGDATRLNVYIWGESLMKDRGILSATIIQSIREIAGQELPLRIESETVGEGPALSWEDRLFPFLVLISIMIGGMMIPASSLVEEKQKRTIRALLTSPASVGEVLMAKGLLGALVSLTSAVMILSLNNAFGARPAQLVLLLALSASLAATFGLLLGCIVKDMTTLFATMKSIGIFLYAPAIVYMFPGIPQWIGRIFPTYYIIAPIIETTQRAVAFGEIAMEVGILCALIVALAIVVSRAAPKLIVRDA